MRPSLFWIALIGHLLLATPPAGAQDYRGRVQGSVARREPGRASRRHGHAEKRRDRRRGDVRGRHGMATTSSTSSSPALYTITGELQGFKTAEQRNVRVPQRGDVTADLTLDVGGIEETVVVEAPPVAVQFNTSSSELTLERQLVDQVPINGRNPYNLANLDPDDHRLTLGNENRPYHHAYANDYDAGGGTRRANDVLLDGVRARRELQDGLHAGGGRGRRDHGLEEQRRRGERPQPRRHHQPEHEVGHQRAPRLRLSLLPRSEPQRDRRSDDPVDARPGRRGAARQRAEDVRRRRSAARSGRTRSSPSRRSSSGTTSGR